ncbi:hypothetical protein [Desulfobulbus alkaliphilus]|uniref:hypothetical protein n=1 Tax=Desulfobulbus alkaliphilus TaxID=869814 RepID=UPI0019666AB9|nr:hypothetical protein [Desulfobulbus alkaliphilus]MBM9536196.1 hypothetical protein [Desulfobulbus alkaliphilus]
MASLLARYVYEDLTAFSLVNLLDEMAKAVDVDNWVDVTASPAMVALKSAPKAERIWACHDYPERPWVAGSLDAGLTYHTLSELYDARKCIKNTVESIHSNIEAGRRLYDGLQNDHRLHDLLGKCEALKPGKVIFTSEEIEERTVLAQEKVYGYDLFQVEAIVSALLREFLRIGAGKYLSRCSTCGQLFLPRRTDAKTCSTRCRKRRSLERQEG